MQMAKTDGSKAIEQPRLHFIVEDAPVDTLLNCESIVRFLGCRMLEIGKGGMDFSKNDAEALLRIMQTVADALAFEAKRAGDMA
jgi:hypothetical protein